MRFASTIVSTAALLYAAACLQEKLSRLLEAFLYYAAETSRTLYLKAYALVRNDKLEDNDKQPKDKLKN
jgi:hypothetical protein